MQSEDFFRRFSNQPVVLAKGFYDYQILKSVDCTGPELGFP